MDFIILMIKMNTQHSSYGNQLSSTDLPNIIILLPVNEDELPAWNYMERFSKTIIDDKMKKYTGYFIKYDQGEKVNEYRKVKCFNKIIY